MVALVLGASAAIAPHAAHAMGGESQVCPGCTDSSLGPPTPSPESGGSGEGTFSINYTVTVTKLSGICTLESHETPTGVGFLVCERTVPCAPLVQIKADLAFDHPDPPVYWEATSTGAVGHDAIDGRVDWGSSSKEVVFYDERARIDCGDSFATTAMIELLFAADDADPFVLANAFPMSFHCSSCSNVILEPGQ